MRGQILQREVYEVGTDGDRVDLTHHSWNNLASLEGPFENAIFNNYVWDGEKCYEYSRFSQGAGRAFITHDDRSKQHHMAVAYQGAPLRGVLYGDDLRVNEILQKAETLKVRSEREEINGSLCYVIDAETQHGRYAVWLDPEHGYNVARAEVTKEGADIAWSKPLNLESSKRLPSANRRGPSPGTKQSFSFSLDNVKFKEVEGVWVPMGADYGYTKTYDDGVVATSKSHYTQTHIDINPDFEAAGMFKPKIENDAAVFIKGVNVAYRWADGELVPNIDEYIVDIMDSEIYKIKTNKDVLINDVNLTETSKPESEEETRQLSEVQSQSSVDNTKKLSVIHRPKKTH